MGCIIHGCLSDDETRGAFGLQPGSWRARGFLLMRCIVWGTYRHYCKTEFRRLCELSGTNQSERTAARLAGICPSLFVSQEADREVERRGDQACSAWCWVGLARSIFLSADCVPAGPTPGTFVIGVVVVRRMVAVYAVPVGMHARARVAGSDWRHSTRLLRPPSQCPATQGGAIKREYKDPDVSQTVLAQAHLER